MENLPLILLLFIVVAVLVVFFLFYGSSTKAPSNNKTSTLFSTAITASTSTSSTSTTTKPSTQSTSCRSNSSSVLILNGNFSTGTYFNWNVTGSGFGTAPFNITQANKNGTYYQHQWSSYASKFFATTYRQISTIVPGNISSNFVVVEPYLNFQIISPYNQQLYVEILQDGSPVIVKHYDTLNGVDGSYNMGKFARTSINMSSLMCHAVQVRVVANVYFVTSSDRNKFIAVGNFYQSRSPSETPGIENLTG